MIKIHLKDEDLQELIGPLKKGSKGHLVGTCPFCGKDNHFFIRYKEEKDNYFYDCKKCKEEGNAWKLLSFLGRLSDFIEQTIDLSNLVLLKTDEKVEDEKLDLEVEDKPLPVGFKRVYSHPYLEDRYFEKKDFYKYRVGTTELVRKYKDYVIFSVDENGKSKGSVARCTLPKKVIQEKGLLRYRNSSSNFGKLLFGYEELTEDTETVILVEGIFDKIRLDNLLLTDDEDDIKIMCTFGNKVTPEQIAKLLIFNVKTVILFYDIDAVNEIKKYSELLRKFFKTVRICCLQNGKDPGESDPEEIFLALTEDYEPTEFKYEKVNSRKLAF